MAVSPSSPDPFGLEQDKTRALSENPKIVLINNSFIVDECAFII